MMKKDKETKKDIEVNHTNHYNQKNHSSDKKGWEIKRLGEVCEELFAGGDVPKDGYSKIKNDTYTIPIFSNGEKNKGLYGFTNIKRVIKPSITISARGTIGYSEIREESFYPAIRLIVAIPNMSTVDLFFLKYVIGNIDFTHSGTSIPQLTIPMIKDYAIPLPPLPEQQRIVSILDEAFAAIGKAKTNAEQNLKNSKELFESYLQGVFENKGEDWEEKMLEELADETCTLSYGIVQPGDEYPNGLPVIRPTDLTRRLINLDGLKRINPKLADGYKRTKLTGNELLLCVRGSTGVVSIALKELEGANVTRGIVPIRFNSKLINQDFGYYLLISNYIQNQIKAKTYGTALMQINIGDLRKILTSYPPLKEQQAIVKKLDALSAETKKLEAIYQKKIKDLEELKKAILQKAFKGELKVSEPLIATDSID